MQWLYLAIAIVSEVVATSALKTAEGFTRWSPSLLVIVGYVLAFYFLSLTLRTIPLGVAYAIWSGVGVALALLVGWVGYLSPVARYCSAHRYRAHCGWRDCAQPFFQGGGTLNTPSRTGMNSTILQITHKSLVLWRLLPFGCPGSSSVLCSTHNALIRCAPRLP